MKIDLPCPLGGVFPGVLADGSIGELCLDGVRLWYDEDGAVSGYHLLATPFPLGRQQRVVEPGEFLPARTLTLPDEVTRMQPIPDMHPRERGRLRAVELQGTSLNFTFDLSEQGVSVTGGCGRLEPYVAPVLISPHCAPQKQASHRALYTVVENDERSYFYHATGAGYTEALRMVEAAEHARSRRPGLEYLTPTIGLLTLRDLAGGNLHGEAAEHCPFEQLGEAQADRLRGSMAYSPVIGMDITVNLDTRRLEYRQGPLSAIHSALPTIHVELDGAMLCLEEAERENRDADMGRGLYPNGGLEHRVYQKLSAMMRQQTAPGRGSGPGGTLLLADLLHLPALGDAQIKAERDGARYPISGISDERMTAAHREAWRDVLGARVADIGMDGDSVVVELRGPAEERLAAFSQALRGTEQGDEPAVGPAMA